MDLTKFIELLEKWLAKRTEYYERQMKSIYEEIIDEILKLIGEIYRKFEKDGVLSRADMYKYKRADNLQRSLNMSINKLSVKKQDALREHLTGSYEYSYDWMSWAIQKESTASYRNVLHKSEMEQRALENPVTGLTLSETLEKHRVDVIQKIRTEVKRGITNGSTYKEMADGLSSTLEDDYKKAVRVVRTESHRVKEQAVLESAQQANANGIVMHKKWLSMRDERVRRTPKANHASMHGQMVPVDDMFDLGNGEKAQAPSMSGFPQHDINCRCITTYKVMAIQAQTDEQLAKQTFEQYQQLKQEERAT